MKSAWVLCASVAISGPSFAQDADPLAPLDPYAAEQPATPPVATPPAVQEPVVSKPAPPPPPPRVIPKDWRGVLLAIGNSEWEAARLGIEGLPDGPLKPYAKAELYTAKDSPKVELAPILALLAEAP